MTDKEKIHVMVNIDYNKYLVSVNSLDELYNFLKTLLPLRYNSIVSKEVLVPGAKSNISFEVITTDRYQEMILESKMIESGNDTL